VGVCETEDFGWWVVVLDWALRVGAFVALLGEVSELSCSSFGVDVFPRYWSSLILLFAGFVEPFVSLGVLTSGSGLSRRYFPVYSGRSSMVVYSKQKHGVFWF
jgi:hypothetical protein